MTQPLLQTIQHTVKQISRIQFLASDLINFHYTRLLEEGLVLPLKERKELPVLNQSFLLKCCIIVTDTKSENRDAELVESFNRFESLYAFPENEYLGDFLASLARHSN